MNYILQKELLFGGCTTRILEKGRKFLKSEASYSSDFYIAENDIFVTIHLSNLQTSLR